MKSFIAIALATTALIAAAPSFAQNNSDDAIRGLRSLLGHPVGDPAERDLNDQERRLTDLIQQSAREHRIDHEQADRAFGQLREIHGQQDDLRARHGRLTQGDHDYLRDRLAGLDREVDHMREAGGPPRGDFWDRAPADLDQREEWLDRRIHDGMADGSLDRGEAHNALEQLRSIRNDESRYLAHDRGVLNGEHRAQLNDRLRDLGRQLHWAHAH